MKREKESDTANFIRLDVYKAEQTRKNLDRFNLRRERTEELRRISGEKLPDEELRFWIEELMWRYDKIAYYIPSPVTFHREDGDDKWDLECGVREDEKTRFLEMKRKESSNEYEVFALEVGADHVLAMHTETRQPELLESQNSEREIGPARELFDRLWSPLEEKLEAPYSALIQKFDS